ncbi:MAG: antirestriction protein ArdA, partial [Oscillospiraceae bacterium]|nr:antirestriction protein ArdA [Oscillospiraceae bacterium]
MNLYLEQIAKWLENTTGVSQQIIHTKERNDIGYIDYDSRTAGTNMTLITDADIEVNKITWSGRYGIRLNDISESGEKVHVILWSDDEVMKDKRGYYMDSEGALNGVLVITNPDIKVTDGIVQEMLDINRAVPLEANSGENFREKIQDLMDEVYDEWNKEENKGKGKWDILDGFSEAHKIAVTFGNFNYQVENGGIDQWIYNGYFHDDAEKLTEFLETGAETDERCRKLLDSIYTLDQYAQETDCDRDGNYYDPENDGDSSFIGDVINGDEFDDWYYANCGKDDWWEMVSGIIDKVEPRGLAPDEQHEHIEGDTPLNQPIRVYIENIVNENIGGFTMPLPATREEIQPFLESAEITSYMDMAITETFSDIKGLDKRLGEAIETSWHPDILNEINYLAARIKEISEHNGLDIFCANIEAGRNCGSIAEMINITFTENLNRFDVQPCFDAEMYGDFLVENWLQDVHADAFNRLKKSDDPADRAFAAHIEKLETHADKEAFGLAAVKDENGVFTEQGYLSGGDGLLEIYRSPEDIPVELFVQEEYPAELRSLSRYITPDADKSELAYLADIIAGMDGEQRRLFDTVAEGGWHCNNVTEIINMTQTLDCFTLQPAFNESEYGEYRLMRDWDESREAISRLEKSANADDRTLAKHITLLNRCADEETYGYHAMRDSGGVMTQHGFLVMDEVPKEMYRGVQDLPSKYRADHETPRASA